MTKSKVTDGKQPKRAVEQPLTHNCDTSVLHSTTVQVALDRAGGRRVLGFAADPEYAAIAGKRLLERA